MKEDITKLKKDLSDHELAVFESEMEKYKKSTGLTYLLWFFFGSIGIHQFYMGKVDRGILYLFLGIASWLYFFLGGTFIVLGGICAVVLGILLLVDLFTIPRQLRKEYEEAEREVILRIKKARDPSKE